MYRQGIDAISRKAAAVLDQFLAEELIEHSSIPGHSPGLHPTNRPVTLPAIHTVRFEADRIVESWGIADLLGAIHQLEGKVVPG